MGYLFSHVGKGGQLFVIFIKNVLLSIITLGIYHFWGKTNIRRYVWSHTQLNDEPFEYTGTGKELLLGMLKALVVLVPLYAGFTYLQMIMLDFETAWIVFITIASVLIFYFIIGLATYSARRYKLSRTRWQGIRFAQTGSAIAYGLDMMFAFLLVIITLGLYIPAMDNQLAAYRTNNTWAGTIRLGYSGKAKDLYKPFLALYTITVIAWGAAISYAIPNDQPELIALALIVMPLWLFYFVYEFRYFLNHTHISKWAQISSEITGFKVALLLTVNLLILILTLGLGRPWVITRTVRFICNNVQISGQLNFDAIKQNQEKQNGASGEGLMDTFDMGAI